MQSGHSGSSTLNLAGAPSASPLINCTGRPELPLSRIHKIVLVAHDNEGSARLFDTIVSSYPQCQFLLVLGKGLYYKKSFVASVFKMLQEASWIFVFVRFCELVMYKLFGDTLRAKCRRRGIPIIFTHDINSDATCTELRTFAPDLLISLFTMQIYKAASLSIPRYGAITSHPSILPKYRGLEVFFWVLANDEKETGVSVFFITEKIDAGRVVRQQVLPIKPDHTVRSLYHEITTLGGDLLVKAISDIDRDQITEVPQCGPASYYKMPDADAYRRFRKLGKRFF